jgi:hypothetical protein
MGNKPSNPFNPYSQRIDALKRELTNKTNQDEQLHSDMFGQDPKNTLAHPQGGIDDNGTGIYPIILNDLSGLTFPESTIRINSDENKKPYLATLGLKNVQDALVNNITSQKAIFDTNVVGYYNLQEDIFGKSRDNQNNHNDNDTGYSLIKQITDLSGEILIAEKRKAYLKMTELTGSQFSFEAVKEQNNSLQNQINENTATYSKDESKIEYQIQQNTSMKIFNSVLLIIYGICLLVLAVVLFGINQRFSFVTKVAIVIVFMLFPFCFLILQQLTESIRSFIHRNYPNSNVYLAST